MNHYKRLLWLLFCVVFASFAFSEEMSKDERKNVNRYIKDLKSKDDSVRYEAVESLQYYPYPEVVVLLSGALKDPSSSVRNRAALSLYEMKEKAHDAIPALQEALQDPDAFVRINAGATLMNMDVDENLIIPAVRELLQRPEPRTRIAAARFLQGSIPFPELLPVLGAGLKNPDPSIRVEASKVFGDSKELPADALPVLVDALKDPSAEVRKNAASGLKVFKSKGTPAIPALVAALKDNDPAVRMTVVDAIESMGTWGKDALPALGGVIRNDPDASVRKYAVSSLEWIDPEGRTGTPFLLEALKDQDAEVRKESLETMLSLRPFPVQAVPQVRQILASESNADVKIVLDRVVERGEREKSYGTPTDTGSMSSGKTPAKKGNSGISKEEATQLLQEKGVQMTTDEFWSHVVQGDAEIVQAMLSAGFPANTAQGGMSALMIATRTYRGEPEKKQVILSLIDFGADVNYKDDIDTTPLFHAAGKCEVDLLSAMIKAGAILEARAKGGATTLSEAVFANCVENVRLLLKSGYKMKNEPAWLLSTTKNAEIAAMLRKAGLK